MADTRVALHGIRERTIVSVSLAQQLADLALLAPPSLMGQLEVIAATAYECATRNLSDVTALIDASCPASLAA